MQVEYLFDAYDKGRMKGIKLSKEDVKYIRNSKIKGVDMAKFFNCCRSTIYRIRNNQRRLKG